MGGWEGSFCFLQCWVLFMQLNPDPQCPILSTAAEDLGPMAWGVTQGKVLWPWPRSPKSGLDIANQGPVVEP